MSDDKKLNLPALKRTGQVSVRPTAGKIKPLDLSKSAAVSQAMESQKTVQEEVARSEQGLDLVLVGDLTASMKEYHTLLKKKFSALCAELFPMIKNLKIGIVFYLDHDSGLPYVTRIKELSQDVTELQNFIKETPVLHSGNSTNDEAMECAFHDVVNINWREGGSRSVVLFGDARPHEPIDCPLHRDYFDLTQKMYNKNIVVNSVFCGGKSYSDEGLQKLEDTEVGDFSKRVANLYDPNFFSWVANVTGGMVIGIEQIDDLINIIKAVAAKEAGKLDELEKNLKSRDPRMLKLIPIAKKAAERRNIAMVEKAKLLGHKKGE